MKKIRIDLDNDMSIDKAIQEIEELKKQIESFPAYVAEKNAPLAQQGYADVQMNGSFGNESDPNINVRVTVVKKPKRAWIKAQGEDVAFAEFGAGIGTSQTDTTADGGDAITTGQGTWSQSEGKGHIPLEGDRGYWFYNGKYYTRIYPTYAMRRTTIAIKRDIGKLAQEHFK